MQGAVITHSVIRTLFFVIKTFFGCNLILAALSKTCYKKEAISL